MTLRVHKNLYPYLIFDKLDTDSNSGGARIVVSKLEREVTVPLSRYINEHPMEKEIFVSIGGEMAVMNKRMVESEAYVHVGTKFLSASSSAGSGAGTGRCNLYDREARAGISNRTAPGWIPAAAYRTCPAFSNRPCPTGHS